MCNEKLVAWYLEEIAHKMKPDIVKRGQLSIFWEKAFFIFFFELFFLAKNFLQENYFESILFESCS
jgi:hypothetical protein